MNINKKKVDSFVKKVAKERELERGEANLFLLDYAMRRMAALGKYQRSPKGKRARKKAK